MKKLKFGLFNDSFACKSRLRFLCTINVLLFLFLSNYGQTTPSPQEQTNKSNQLSPRQAEWEKKKKKLIKEEEKKYEKLKKEHYKIQSKTTKKQMKEYEKLSQKTRSPKKKFFLIRWLQKKKT